MRVVTATPTTAATLMLPANPNRQGFTLLNNGAVTVYLGTASAVTTLTGFPIPAGQGLEVESSTEAIYGVVASGTGDIRIIET